MAATLSTSMMHLCFSLLASFLYLQKTHFCQDAVWSPEYILLDDSWWSLCHPASDSRNDFHKILSGRNHGISFRALSQRSFIQFLLPFPSVILVCISAHTLPSATMWSYHFLYQVWQTWALTCYFIACCTSLWTSISVFYWLMLLLLLPKK